MIEVLVIDDDEVDRLQAERLAKRTRLPVRIRAVATAAEGLTSALESPPHVILLDMNLGAVSGEETVEALRQAGVDAAIVLLTGTTDPERIAHAIAAGAMKYVPKSALDVARLESVLLSGSRVTIAERKAASMQRAAERRSRQLEQLVEASVEIAAETTIEATVARTLAGARAMFETHVRVQAVVPGVEDTAHTAQSEAGELAFEDTVRVDQKAGAYMELRLGRPLQADERNLAIELARIAIGNVMTLALMREAQAAARDRQDIVAVVSHDLRTPLQSLSLGIDTLKLGLGSGRSPADLVPTTDRMRRSVVAMSRLLDDLLDVSRIHDRALRVQPSDADLDSVLSEVRDMHLPIAEAKGLSLRVEPSGLRLVMDPQRVAQALTNFVSNALRHTSQGEVLLRAREHDGEVRVEVIDTGPGIALEVQRRLFERLFQDVSSSKSGALGLGLYIVRGIAEAHGGRAGVESTVGEGSCFYLVLPRRSLSRGAGAGGQGISTSAQ